MNKYFGPFSTLYEIHSFKGLFNADTGYLSVRHGTQTFEKNKWLKMVEEPGPYNSGATFRLSFCHADNPDGCGESTINSWWDGRREDVPPYLGEVAQTVADVLQIPPIPLLAADPVPGEGFELESVISTMQGSLFTGQERNRPMSRMRW